MVCTPTAGRRDRPIMGFSPVKRSRGGVLSHAAWIIVTSIPGYRAPPGAPPLAGRRERPPRESRSIEPFQDAHDEHDHRDDLEAPYPHDQYERTFAESAISGETNPADMPQLHMAETTSNITLLESKAVGCRCITSTVATKIVRK